MNIKLLFFYRGEGVRRILFVCVRICVGSMLKGKVLLGLGLHLRVVDVDTQNSAIYSSKVWVPAKF